MKCMRYIILLLFISITGNSVAQRQRINFDDDWRFTFGLHLGTLEYMGENIL